LGRVQQEENEKIIESWMGTGSPQDWKERASLGGYAIPGSYYQTSNNLRAPPILIVARTGWTGPARTGRAASSGKTGRGSKK
jgi:hypothetical protein